MELEPLFVNSKWDILTILSKQDSSPTEIAERLSSTVANISQQLRLLEAAGLITKRRLVKREKGKPRTVYSITDNFSYVVSCTRGYTEKRLIRLNDYQRYLMHIWCVYDPPHHDFLEKIYSRLSSQSRNIVGFSINEEPRGIYVNIIQKKPFSLPEKLTVRAGEDERMVYFKAVNNLNLLNDGNSKFVFFFDEGGSRNAA